MRVSTTITDEMNMQLVELAQEKGVSKDKLISLLLVDALSIKHNERGAGRKPVLDDDKIKKVCHLRAYDNTIKTIAKELNCSVGLVHKIINENSDMIDYYRRELYFLNKGLISDGLEHKELSAFVEKYKDQYEE